MSRSRPLVRTAYVAARAASLAGIPKSTLHYRARTGLLVPSVCGERVKTWSFKDLMTLRVIDWLRTDKKDPQGREVPRTSTPRIRRALKQIRTLDRAVWSEIDGPAVKVDRRGKIFIVNGRVMDLDGQVVIDEVLDLLAPFQGSSGLEGPDLCHPRPHLCIVPGKLAGEPHVQETRVETRTLWALAARGYPVEDILAMYPFLEKTSVDEAIELEEQLARNLAAAA